MRLGKLLRLRKEPEEAKKVYEIGLIKANKKDQMYQILEKQLKTVEQVTNTSNPAIQSDSGNLLTIPENVLNQICDYLNLENRSTLKNFALTSSSAFNIVMKGILRGTIGESTDFRSLKSSQLYSKLFKEYSVLEKFNNQSCALKINSESATLLFLMYLKKVMTSLKGPVKIKNLSVGPIATTANFIELFEECLRRGLNIQRLRINFTDFNSSKFTLKHLKELIITNYKRSSTSDEVNSDIKSSLECLQVIGDEGCKLFSNCKSLKYLNYSNESDFNSFMSEKIILASLKYERSITMRPRPIKYLSLQGGTSCESLDCIDLTQYSYESIIILHLDQMTLNSLNETQDIIKSSCWNSLKCLRLNRIFLKNPKKDLTWILSKCPKNLEILELVSIPLSGLNDFNTNENGIWLIELIFKSFTKLRHLILGDLMLGPSAVNSLIKNILSKRLTKLKVVGFIKIQTTLGFNSDQSLTQTLRSTYPWSYLIVNDRQYQVYSNEFNLFKNGKIFLTI